MKKIIMISAALLYGITLSSGALAAGEYDTKTQTMQQEKQAGNLQTPAEQQMRSATKLIGEAVNGQEGKKIGQISDLMVDTNSGRINFVLLSSGGVLGINKDQYIVPWKALRQDPQTSVFSLNISDEKFKSAPQGETVATRERAVEIYQFYGVAPSWGEGGPNMQGIDRPMMEEPGNMMEGQRNMMEDYKK